MYLLLVPLFAAVLFDRIQKLKRSIKKDDRDAVRSESFHVGLIIIVGVILLVLIEVRPE